MTTAPARRPVRVADLVVSIVLLLLSVGLGLILLFFAPFLAMASDGCGSGAQCDYDRMGAGLWVALIGPILLVAAGVVATIVLLVLRRLAFWVPLASSALAFGVFLLGGWLVVSGVPGATF